MRTSYSSLNTYKTCPLKYKYGQIDKLKEPKRVEQVFGTLIHSALKFMFERNPVYPTPDEVINFYTNKWSEKSEYIEWRNPDKQDAEEKMYFEEGIKIIKNFYKKNQPWTFNVVELEGRFSLELEDETTGKVHTLAGIIDRIDKDPDSEVYEIIDYKTGKKMPAQKDLETDLQLGLYHLALSVRWPQIKPEKITTSLYFLRHNEKISSVPPQDIVEQTKLRILESIRAIEKNTEEDEFPATPGPLCNYCGFKSICPMWSHEYIKEEEKTPTDKEAEDALHEFFTIKQADDENKKKIAELRGVLLKYMEDKKLNRVFGNEGYITKSVSERISYDTEKVAEILKDADLLEKILSPDNKKIEEVLASLPKEVLEKVIKLKKVSTTTMLKQTRKKNVKE
ncbi:MAG TPA: PD-(D/E)XK nuclease family protein [Candidatus Yonathbacteria bacterium]|nr:PD-(D/E)XK nuclease family protein [Candidatus Yonathbacteria bacterium]